MRWIIGAGAVVLAIPVTAQPRVAINLNTHSRVEIERPAAAIWPHIVDPNSWKQGLELTRRAGTAGQLGEILAAGDPGSPGGVAFFAENVEVVPNQRRTIKLYEPAGRLLGFATWTLQESNGRTVVGYDVYAETLLAADQARSMTSEVVAAREREGYQTNKQRFDAELVALKRLVEGRP